MEELRITETVMRDGNQSLAATRIPIEDFIPILKTVDQAGYYSVECWGGATFDTCLRYLKEDPWERLKTYRKFMPNTKLQMLMRGQCILGYKHYPDTMVREFVRQSIKNGIDVIRIFDALNDVKNMEIAIDETIHCGALASCAISYTESPVHDLKGYVELAKEMERLGACSVCIKDMSGILSPEDSKRLIFALKNILEIPVILHSHCTTGNAYLSYYEAIKAGVDGVDTAISPFSGGTSQPATELIINIAKDLGRKITVDESAIRKIKKYFGILRGQMDKERKINYKSMISNPEILKTQIPGGMYSNLLAQLSILEMEDKIQAVEEEVPMVRADLGYPPLVTPISQMIGVQAVSNVVTGERYKTVSKEIRDYFEGKYGVPPGEVNKTLMYTITGKTEFPEKRYALSLEKRYEQVRLKLKDEHYSETDILSLLLFPEQAELFLKEKNMKKESKDFWKEEYSENIPNLEEIPDLMQNREFLNETKDNYVRSLLPGNVQQIFVKNGEAVKKGEILMVLETMKMENEIFSEEDGVIDKVFVKPGDRVQKGECLIAYARKE